MRINTLALAFAGILMTFGSSAQAITVSTDHDADSYSPGSVITIDISISDLGNGEAPSVGAYDIDLLFDSAILTFDSVTFGDQALGDQLDLWGMGSMTDYQIEPNSAGSSINLFELSFDDPADLIAMQADSFVLASLTFTANAVGTSHLDLIINDISDAEGINSLSASTIGSSVQVVPVPAAFPLLASGLAFVFIRRRRR